MTYTYTVQTLESLHNTVSTISVQLWVEHKGTASGSTVFKTVMTMYTQCL